MRRPREDGPTFRPGAEPRPAPPRPETELSRTWRYRLAGSAGARLLLALGGTWRVRWQLPPAVRDLERAGEHLIYAFWHQHILPLAYTHRRRGIVVMVSAHGDGEYITQVIHHLGFGTVRGSSTRGGLRAALEQARLGREGYPLGISPDGPRGPRHVCQPGAVVIAQRSGLPLVPLAVGMRRGRRLDSWDRFEIPAPGSEVLVAAGEPIFVPPELTLELAPDGARAEAQEAWRRRVQEALDENERRAQAWEAGKG